MSEARSFTMSEEFSGIKFNDKRRGKRFIKTMETLAKDPTKTIYGSSANQAEYKAIYRLLGNEKFDIGEVIKVHAEATIRRMPEKTKILLVQDTTSVDYNGQKAMEGNGYICEDTMGINIHTCLAVTGDGLPLGVLDQIGFNRKEPKNTELTEGQKKNRSIEEKESYRWLKMMENVGRRIPAGTDALHVCDREGDIYELFDKAICLGQKFLIRIVQDRMTVENTRILGQICKVDCAGRVKVKIPRDSRKNVKERDAILQIRYAKYEIKKPAIKKKDDGLLPSLSVNVIQVKEEDPPEGVEGVEWFLMTNEEVGSVEAAYEEVGYYMQRWKIERFHYVLKSGCKVEKLQERSMERMKALILMYSVIAVFIMNLTYIARINPDLPCTVMLEGDEWQILYCLANKTKELPTKVYTIKEAVQYLGWMGGPKRPPSAGPPGVKTIWTGLQKFYTLLGYRTMFNFMGQV